jgi:hypothetical protein
MATHFRDRWFRPRPPALPRLSYARWCWGFYRWAARVSLRPPRRSVGPLTAVLLSWKRPQNIDLIARSLLLTPSVGRVVVSNNNPEVPIREWISVRSPRLETVEQPRPRGSASRLWIAREAGKGPFLLIDDDFFLYPRVLERLCRGFLESPSAPRGIIGQLWDAEKSRLSSGHFGFDGELDVLNRIYLLSEEQMERSFAILGELGMKTEEEIVHEDLLLSFSGEGRPRCQAAGGYRDCLSYAEAGVAVMRRPGFHRSRNELFLKLRAHLHGNDPSSR